MKGEGGGAERERRESKKEILGVEIIRRRRLFIEIKEP